MNKNVNEMKGKNEQMNKNSIYTLDYYSVIKELNFSICSSMDRWMEGIRLSEIS